MTSLWFVTPAWQRYEMTALCLEQRRQSIEWLGRHGVTAHQVVIADDENLDIARDLGAAVVERDNAMVGRKFNDGMAYAGRQGADWIVPIGSDSWLDPHYLLPLLPPRQTLTSEAYCAVTATTLAELWVSPGRPTRSAGPYVFHRSLLEPCRFRPSAEDSRMVDTSTIGGILRHRTIRWVSRTLHPFQYVGFRVPPMMTRYENLWRRWGVAEHDPWRTLAAHYPADLVERARTIMTREVAA